MNYQIQLTDVQRQSTMGGVEIRMDYDGGITREDYQPPVCCSHSQNYRSDSYLSSSTKIHICPPQRFSFGWDQDD